MAQSNIEWTEESWNPVVGCSIVSPGCTNCYAMKMAHRIEGINAEARAKGTSHAKQYDGTTKVVNGNAVWTGKVHLAEHILLNPLKRKKPTTYFVNSMGDLFHEDVPDEWIDLTLAVGALCPQHTLQILTKRAKRMHAYMTTPDRKKIIAERVMDISNRLAALGGHQARIKLDHFSACFAGSGPFKNIWLGVSTERQQEADERIPLLLQTPAAIRFISAEPLLGPIDVTKLPFPKSCECEQHAPTLDAFNAAVFCEGCCEGPEAMDLGKLSWIIVGGESGPDARPMSIQWARELRDQCKEAEVPFFFKQWGEWYPAGVHPSETPGRFAFGDYEHDRSVMIQVDSYPRQFTKFGARSVMERVGKKAAGRALDGIEYSEMPVLS